MSTKSDKVSCKTVTRVASYEGVYFCEGQVSLMTEEFTLGGDEWRRPVPTTRESMKHAQKEFQEGTRAVCPVMDPIMELSEERLLNLVEARGRMAWYFESEDTVVFRCYECLQDGSWTHVPVEYNEINRETVFHSYPVIGNKAAGLEKYASREFGKNGLYLASEVQGKKTIEEILEEAAAMFYGQIGDDAFEHVYDRKFHTPEQAGRLVIDNPPKEIVPYTYSAMMQCEGHVRKGTQTYDVRPRVKEWYEEPVGGRWSPITGSICKDPRAVEFKKLLELGMKPRVVMKRVFLDPQLHHDAQVAQLAGMSYYDFCKWMSDEEACSVATHWLEAGASMIDFENIKPRKLGTGAGWFAFFSDLIMSVQGTTPETWLVALHAGKQAQLYPAILVYMRPWVRIVRKIEPGGVSYGWQAVELSGHNEWRDYVNYTVCPLTPERRKLPSCFSGSILLDQVEYEVVSKLGGIPKMTWARTVDRMSGRGSGRMRATTEELVDRHVRKKN